jgi:hypothetical protein
MVSTTSGECVILGLKLADGEAHAFRLVGLFLFLAGVSILVCEWRKRANDEAAAIAFAPVITHHTRPQTFPVAHLAR